MTLDEPLKELIAAWSQYLSNKRAGATVSRSDVIRYLAKSTPLPKEVTILAAAVHDAYVECFGDE